MNYPQYGAYVPGANLSQGQGFIGPTQAQSATNPTTPKTQYITQQAQNIQPTGVNTGGGVLNLGSQVDSSGQAFGFGQQQTSAPPNVSNQSAQYGGGNSLPTPTATPNPTTDFTGSSTGVAGQGIYDPYNSPAYQNYLQQAQQAYQPTQAQTDALTNLQNIQKNLGYAVANQARDDIAMGNFTGLGGAHEASLIANAQAPLAAAQTGLTQANTLQGQQATGAGLGLTSANTQAGYLAGRAAPITLAGGQSLATLNPATGNYGIGGTAPVAAPYTAGTNSLTGAPYTYNQTTGQINPGGTNLGTTPPALGGSGIAGTVASTLQSLGAGNDPTATAFYTNAVNQAMANGGNPDPSLNSQQQSIVKQILSQMSGGQYSSQNAAINQGNLTAQQGVANQLIAPAQTATQHLGDLQALANAVNYSNSPIASNVRNQLNSSILTDPSITNLQSAIGVVRAEVAKVLGGGSATVASQAEAQDALPDNLSPQNIAGVIANVQKLMNQKIQEYSNPKNAASLPTGLNMPAGFSASSPPAGTFTLK